MNGYTFKEAREKLMCSESLLETLAKGGKLPAIRNAFTGEWEFNRKSIDWLAYNIRREMAGKA